MKRQDPTVSTIVETKNEQCLGQYVRRLFDEALVRITRKTCPTLTLVSVVCKVVYQMS